MIRKTTKNIINFNLLVNEDANEAKKDKKRILMKKIKKIKKTKKIKKIKSIKKKKMKMLMHNHFNIQIGLIKN